jgi:hypothetical protein
MEGREGVAGRSFEEGNDLRLAFGFIIFLIPPSCVGSVREGRAQAIKSMIGPKTAISAKMPP